MLQGSLTSLLSQVSLFGYRLLIATFKNPSKHAFCLCSSFPGYCEQPILRNTKERFGFHCVILAFASVPWFIMLNYLCVGDKCTFVNHRLFLIVT